MSEENGKSAPGLLHDLANVVGGAQRLAELALHQLPPGHPARREIQALLGNCLQGSALVRRLLGAEAADGDELELNSMVAAVVARHGQSHGNRIRFRHEADNVQYLVRMDGVDFQRALDNLILNAIAAMEGDGEVVLRVRRGADGEALIEVSDTGCGMDADTVGRVFEEGYTSKTGPGHGLGLNVVRRVVEENGGSVRVASVPGEGTTFRLYLPLAKPPETLGSETILLVDDHAEVRSSVRQVLQESGYRVREAASGAEALELLDARIDLLLTDLKLPDMDGTALAAAARDAHHGLKVVYMSGYKWNGGRAPDAPLLIKPTPPDELRKTISALFAPPAEAAAVARHAASR